MFGWHPPVPTRLSILSGGSNSNGRTVASVCSDQINLPELDAFERCTTPPELELTASARPSIIQLDVPTTPHRLVQPSRGGARRTPRPRREFSSQSRRRVRRVNSDHEFTHLRPRRG